MYDFCSLLLLNNNMLIFSYGAVSVFSILLYMIFLGSWSNKSPAGRYLSYEDDKAGKDYCCFASRKFETMNRNEACIQNRRTEIGLFTANLDIHNSMSMTMALSHNNSSVNKSISCKKMEILERRLYKPQSRMELREEDVGAYEIRTNQHSQVGSTKAIERYQLKVDSLREPRSVTNTIKGSIVALLVFLVLISSNKHKASVIASILFVMVQSAQCLTEFLIFTPRANVQRYYDVVVDSSGNYITTGYDDNLLLSDKYDSSGTKLWTYVGCVGCLGRGIDLTLDENYIIAGQQNANTMYAIKLKKDCTVMWQKSYSSENLRSCVTLTSGDYVFAGFATGNKGYIMKVEMNTGVPIWQSESASNSHYNSVYASDGSTIYVAGTIPTTRDICIFVRFGSNGFLLGQTELGSSQNESCNSIAHLQDGNFVLAGYTDSAISHGHDDIWLIKVNNLGVKIWDNAYGSISYNERAHSVTQLSVGYLLVGGFSLLSGKGDMFMLTVSQDDGTYLWHINIGVGNMDERIVSVNSLPNGGMVAVGYSEIGLNDNDIFLGVYRQHPCGPAAYLNNNDCIACSPGSYQSNEDQTECLACTSGHYQPDERKTSCLTCSAGTYSGPGASSCIQCLAGTYSKFDRSACENCPDGKYSTIGSDSCSNCPPGSYSVSGDATCTQCGAGTFSITGSGVCTECVAGTFSSAGASGCTYCSDGTSSSLASSSCTPCVGGKFSNVVTNFLCTNCPLGYYSNANAVNCIPCDLGSISTSLGSSSCTLCSPGTYNGVAGAIVCPACPIGKFSNAGASVCSDCPKGTYSDGMTPGCPDCSPGTYTDVSASTFCKNCTAGKYSEVKAEFCINCPIGTYSNDRAGSCTNCSAGQYNPNPGSSSCFTCLAGTYSEMGSDRCIQCENGTYSSNGAGFCLNCAAGTFSGKGAVSCQNCDPGTYSLEGSPFCTNCTAGYFSLSGAPSCTACPGGKYSGPGASFCLSCINGTYSNSGDPICTNCSAGFYSLAESSSCTQCGNGTYSGPGAPTCTLCPAGTASDTLGATSIATCIDCIPGTYSNDGAPNCTFCEPGKYNPFNRSSSCINCSRDFHNPDEGAVNISSCLPCDIGYFADPGSDWCKPCHKLCSKCLSAAYDNCLSCFNYTHVIKYNLACMCDSGFFFNGSEPHPDYCQSCHEFCETCNLTRTNCQTCKFLPRIYHVNSTCSCNEGGGYFLFTRPSGFQECTTCFPLCDSCYGPDYNQCGSCLSTKKGTYRNPDSCICTNHLYYNPLIKDCTSCDSLCLECTGPTNTECNGCSSLGFSVEGNSTLCVSSCSELTSHYQLGKACKRCHNVCSICFGSSSSNCILCANLTLVQYRGNCVETCPTKFVSVDRICMPCHYTCETCVNTTSLGCSGCVNGRYLYKGKCLENCPAQTYPINGTCKPCVSPCDECKNETKCITCAKGFYLNPFNKSCGEHCPPQTFADDATRTCIICHYSCYSCIGETRYDCVICNFALGFARSSGSFGPCYELVCTDGEFVLINNETNSAKCEKCHPTCRTCVSQDREGCITCIKGYIPILVPKGQSLAKCIACPELDAGLRAPIKSETRCQGICGDGLRRGAEECDDANTEDGDGCSSECKLEEGFKCDFSEEQKRDVCINIVPIVASIQNVNQYNVITVGFSKLVRCALDETQFTEQTIVKLENAESECVLKWALNSSYEKDAVFNSIKIKALPQCIIRENGEQVRITFPTAVPIRDLYNHSLANPTLIVPLRKRSFISESEKAILTSGGAGFTASTFITFGLAAAPAMLQSVAIGQFWAFINMIQMLSYIPTMNILIPKNFEILLSDYLSVAQISIPFNLMPSWVPNPKLISLKFLTAPLADGFNTCGLSSVSFIYNFADQLFTWLMVGAMYIFLTLLNCIRPEKSFLFIKKMKEEYEFNVVLRILLETYLQMSVCSIVNIYGKTAPTFENKLSLAGASIALILAVAFLVISLRLLEKHPIILESGSFKEKYGTLTEGLKIRGSSFVKGYNAVYLIRRILYAILLVMLHDIPDFQLVACTILAIAPMTVYLIICRPFETQVDNILNILNESFLLLIFIALMGLQKFRFSTYSISIMGWLMVGCVIFSLLSTWFLLLPTLVRSFAEMLKDAAAFICRKNQQNLTVKNESDITSKKVSNTNVEGNHVQNVDEGITAENKRQIINNDVRKNKDGVSEKTNDHPEENKRQELSPPSSYKIQQFERRDNIEKEIKGEKEVPEMIRKESVNTAEQITTRISQRTYEGLNLHSSKGLNQETKRPEDNSSFSDKPSGHGSITVRAIEAPMDNAPEIENNIEIEEPEVKLQLEREGNFIKQKVMRKVKRKPKK